MKITVQADQENDALYLAFADDAFGKGRAAKTVRISDAIAVDLGERGELIGIDILSASSVVGDLKDISIESLIGVKEASNILGVRPPNFIRDYADDPVFPSPVARLASGRIWLKSQVESFQKARPRKSARPSRAAASQAAARPKP